MSGREVLAALAEVPISTWQYESEPGDVAHMGPMAQDFADAFGLGSDRKHITTVDADGVALAAIKGLQERLGAQRDRIARLERIVKGMASRR